MLSKPNNLLENLDHLVFTASSLDVGMNEVEGILGVRPVRGGRHPDFGTQIPPSFHSEHTYLITHKIDYGAKRSLAKVG